ncbi:MAG: hypothetical protein JRG80_12285 [Deltaproteobacteria bacterium]|jgi:hypothetical protein|nr:hypothetical protein [Deltaproteobacteria bacterium]MBW2400034.1 hypothetical protein [Deltaproteobacteria bacterium]MBW2666057.1 hypothetical protein [Deltaproteobacteria bacterium]
MWDYVVGVVCILSGVYVYAASIGRVNWSKASIEYWSNMRAQQPALIKYLPPFLVAFGVLRIVFGLTG